MAFGAGCVAQGGVVKRKQFKIQSREYAIAEQLPGAAPVK